MKATRQHLAAMRAAGSTWGHCAKALGVSLRRISFLSGQPEFAEDVRLARELLLAGAVESVASRPRRRKSGQPPARPPRLPRFMLAELLVSRMGMPRACAEAFLEGGLPALQAARLRDAARRQPEDPREAGRDALPDPATTPDRA